jgi:hypothetical protein
MIIHNCINVAYCNATDYFHNEITRDMTNKVVTAMMLEIAVFLWQ